MTTYLSAEKMLRAIYTADLSKFQRKLERGSSDG